MMVLANSPSRIEKGYEQGLTVFGAPSAHKNVTRETTNEREEVFIE